MSYFFTSEAVSKGHPDKVADQISDAILDNIIAQDPNAHVACETLVTTGMAVVSGEISTDGYVDVQNIVRDTVNGIGYNQDDLQFSGHSIGVLSAIHEQSPDIAMGVDKEDPKDQGAGDQGMMFGYAIKNGINYMPLELSLARKIINNLLANTYVLGPDAKSQVTIEYDDNHKPIKVDTIIVSVQHREYIAQDDIRKAVQQTIDTLDLPTEVKSLMFNYKLIVNPTGQFIIGGPAGDTGLTGRKIIVDTYGGHCPHGGGAFSGKDPSKVDRSAAYMCRYVAKNLVAAGVCDECTVQVSYGIGLKDPISIFVDTHNTSHVEHYDSEIAEMLPAIFDFTPYGIIEHLKLKNPIYLATAGYGPFGWEPYEKDGIEYFTWEKTDKVDELKEIFSIC